MSAERNLQSHDNPCGRERAYSKAMKMKTMLCVGWFLLSASLIGRAAESPNELFQRGLIEEEAQRDLPAAIRTYEEVVRQLDSQRRLEAAVIFRLGETYRKLGRTNEAVRSYQRVISDYAEEDTLVTLSRQNLLGLGGREVWARAEAGRVGTGLSKDALRKQRDLLLQEVALIEKHLENTRRAVAAGQAPQSSTLSVERELLGLRRQLAGLEDDLAQSAPPPVGKPPLDDADEEEFEIRRLTKLMANSPDLLNAPNNGLTPLQKAASNGQLNVVEFLLKGGASRDFGGSAKASPLQFAAAAGHKAVVDRLIQEGSPVAAAGAGGVTALHCAAAAGHRLIVARLLETKVDLDPVTTGSAEIAGVRISKGYTPLCAAVDRGHSEIMDLLLAAGANANGGASNSSLPLLAAIGARRSDLVIRLLEKGADPNGRPGALVADMRPAFYVPLEAALRTGDALLVKLLLHKGADVKAANPRPILHAILSSDQFDLGILKLLLEAGADPNVADPTRRVLPLNVALRNRSLGPTGLQEGPVLDGASRKLLREAVLLLLDYKADLKAALESEPTAWFEAAFASDDESFVRTLIAHGLPVDHSLNGETLLQMSCRVLKPARVATLLDLKADPNRRMPGNGTLLNFVQRNFLSASGPGPQTPEAQPGEARARATEIRDLLVRYGAKLDVPDRQTIQVRRGERSAVVFRRGTNDWNRFTFFELIGAVFLNVPTGAANDLPKGPPFAGPLYPHPYQYPVLREAVIHRAQPDGTRKEIRPNLENVALDWGDIVDLPEAVHAVNAQWSGMDAETKGLVFEGLRRKAKLRIGGKDTELNLSGRFGLKAVLTEGNYLLTSSDLKRIRVMGARSKEGQLRVAKWTVNIADLGSEPDFWLREGDEVEIPERSGSN